MKIFTKNNPLRFVWISLLTFALIGYFLFVVVSLLQIPGVFKESLAYFAKHIVSLDTAEKVALLKGNDPFAIQVLILYSALGSIVLTIWCLQRWLSNSPALAISMEHYFSLPDHKRPSKLRVLLASSSIVGSAFFGWFVLFCMTKTSIGWREATFFSNTVQSVTALITFSSLISICIPAAIVFTYVAFSKYPHP